MAEKITFDPLCYGETFLEWSFELNDIDGNPLNIVAVEAIMRQGTRGREITDLNPQIDGNKGIIPQFKWLFEPVRAEADVYVTLEDDISDCMYKLIFQGKDQTSKP